MILAQPNEVVVTVDAKGLITCTPDHLTVRGSDAVLKFSLETEGYVFPKEGAVVVENPGKEFPFPSRTLKARPTTATLYDYNTEVGKFKYMVTVQRLADGSRLELDPTIGNDP